MQVIQYWINNNINQAFVLEFLNFCDLKTLNLNYFYCISNRLDIIQGSYEKQRTRLKPGPYFYLKKIKKIKQNGTINILTHMCL